MTDTISLSTVYQAKLSAVSNSVIIDPNAQQSFIDYLDFTGCSGGGQNLNTRAIVNVLTRTETLTNTLSSGSVTLSRSLGQVSGLLLNLACCESPRLVFGYKTAAGSKGPPSQAS